MARTRHDSHILELAKRGAETRVRELIDELRLLTATFPHLRQSVDTDDLPISFLLRRGRDRALKRRHARKRAWTPAARRAAAARMKSYWAKRKRGKAARTDK